MLPLLIGLLLANPVYAARIKDVANLYGVRENSLVGNGIVVGLNRTGDSTQNASAIRALANRLQGLGITLSEEDIKSKNVALVMVTAKLPPGARPGSRVDVQVSSVGDARSIEGGILLLSPMYAPNGMAVASAQGSVIVGGYTATAGNNSETRNHPTVGIVPRGGTVEVEVPNGLNLLQTASVDWILNDPDFTNAIRLANSINNNLGGPYAKALDGSTVRVQVPDGWLGKQPELVAQLEMLNLTLDIPNKVIVDERTGTVVMGAAIPIQAMAIAHGNLTIEVKQQVSVSQPGALSKGQTAVVANDTVKVNEEKSKLTLIEGATVGDVVSALNAMGVSPRDLIIILQAMRAAGGLHAEIETL